MKIYQEVKKNFYLELKHQIVGHMMKTILLYIIATDVSVVTSGDYQRNFVGTDGKVYNHLIRSRYLISSDLF